MIKVKNLENIKDDESITIDKLSGFISDMHSRTKDKLSNISTQNKRKLQNIDEDNNYDQMGGISINSQKGMISRKQSFKRSPQLSRYGDFCQTFERKKYRQNGTQLKQIVTEQKIKIIVQNFIRKLSRNNINGKYIQFTPFYNQQQISFLDSQGIQLNDYISTGIALLSAFQIVVLSIIYTLSIVFDEVNKAPIVQAFQSFSLGFYMIEIFINFITVKFQQGKRLGTLKQIWNFYLKDNFAIDVISAIILIVDLLGQFQITIYFRLFIIVKLSQGLQKIQKLEVVFLHNFYKEQYWSLIKVFLFNFSFAHILAIFLIAMAGMNSDENWMNYKDIINAPWFQKYAWSYYWATTMMLTVGFGDLAATTYQQAIVLTFIEMISCIALAYNINCVGTLISNIRSQDIQKKKNIKVFRKLAQNNDVSEDLSWRINNYIEESSNIKKKFNYEEDNLFVQKLPKGLKAQFLKQSNKKIFQNLPFFKNLMQRTLFSFAQKIQMHVCHPEEIIQHIDDPHNLMILKGGEIGFTCKKAGCDFNSVVVDQLKNMKASDPILISLGFIRQNRSIYQIKSLQYSILYFLQQQTVLSILKGSEMDYQLFCLLRDKSSHIPDQFQLFNCQTCKDIKARHTKFTCPKLHFMPIKQHVANKYIHQFKNGKNKRDQQFQRYNALEFNSLKIYSILNQQQAQKSSMLKSKKQQVKQVSNLLNERKKFQQIDESSFSLVKQISDIKDFFSKNTADLIKNQMNKVLLYGDAHDQVWIVQCDKMKNYKNYFQTDNSCNLFEKYSLQKRLGKTQQHDFLAQIVSRNNISYNGQSKKHIFSRDRHTTNKFSFKTLKSMQSHVPK